MYNIPCEVGFLENWIQISKNNSKKVFFLAKAQKSLCKVNFAVLMNNLIKNDVYFDGYLFLSVNYCILFKN